MRFARSAYLSVLEESSYDRLDGETFAIITVLQLPPNESFKIRVSLESLYEICFFPSAKALIQFPKESKDLLIDAPSRNLAP